MDNEYNKRNFQSPDDIISGRSVVNNDLNIGAENFMFSENWPHEMSDYLKNFTGKKVKVSYLADNGRLCSQQGVLVIAGRDFIGIQSDSRKNFYIIELSAVRCIKIIDFDKNFK